MPSITFPTLEKSITLEKMQRYMGPVTDSVHADAEYAKAAGLRGAVAQGGHLVGFLNELMVRSFGEGFLAGGKIAISFVKVVRPGDTVSARAAVVGTEQTEQGPRINCDVWLENQLGETVVAGTASAFAPPSIAAV